MSQMVDVPKTGIQMGHHMNFATNPTAGSSRTQQAGHLHQRTSSQMAQHSNQMMFMDQSATSHATVSQINRKSSIEAKLGGQAAVGGVIKSDTSGGMNSVDTSQLNSTAASNSGG